MYGSINMALIKCAECHKEISDKAKQCPYCGCPQPRRILSRKVVIWLSATIILCAGIGGIYYYNHVQKAIAEANRRTEAWADTMYPKQPQNYEEFENLMTSYFCDFEPKFEQREELKRIYNQYKANGVSFKDTPIYKNWKDTYRYKFQKRSNPLKF